MNENDSSTSLDSELVCFLTGKNVLAGMTYLDSNGDVLEQRQFHGKIVSVTKSEVILKNPTTGDTFSLPPDFSSYKPAAEGEYRLRATGEIVKNPDLLCTWTVTSPNDLDSPEADVDT